MSVYRKAKTLANEAAAIHPQRTIFFSFKGFTVECATVARWTLFDCRPAAIPILLRFLWMVSANQSMRWPTQIKRRRCENSRIAAENSLPFEKFPPRQKPASFSIDDALEKARQQQAALSKAIGGGVK